MFLSPGGAKWEELEVRGHAGPWPWLWHERSTRRGGGGGVTDDFHAIGQLCDLTSLSLSFLICVMGIFGTTQGAMACRVPGTELSPWWQC